MATDLRQRQDIGRRADPVAHRDTGPGARWPYVATAIVVVVLVAVSVLLMTEETPQTPTSVEQWVATVEGMQTNVREGSGFAPAAAPETITYPRGLENPGPPEAATERTIPGLERPGPYAAGAVTEVREG